MTSPQRSCASAWPVVVAVVLGVVGAGPAALASSGRVTYVAGASIYLDVGARDGVVNGAVFDLVKKRGKPLSCTAVDVAAHHAVCRSEARLRAGDRLTFTAALSSSPPQAKDSAPRAAPPPPPPALADALAQAPAPHVVWRRRPGSSRPAFATRGSVTLRQQVWTTAGADGTFARPSLDASARAGLGLFPGLYAEGALRLQGDAVAPASERFRPGDVQLYLWSASIGVAEGSVVGALGRFRPRRAPGMQLLDGAQAGFTALGGALELGAYAGAIPDAVTVAPSLDRLTAGAYFALDLGVGKDVLVLPRARVGLVSSPDGKTIRAEAEGEAQVLWDGVVATAASARVGAGGSASPLPSLDAARLDVDALPAKSLRLHGGWHYLAPLVVDWDPGLSPVGGAHHGDASARSLLDDWLVLGADAGVALDVPTAAARGYAGPVLGLPRAFGAVGGLELGYFEESALSSLSWSGRSAYVAATMSPLEALRVVTRVWYFEDAAPNDSLREVALMTLLDAPVLPWLSLRGRFQVQQTLAPLDGSARKSPTAFIGDVGVSGSL